MTGVGLRCGSVGNAPPRAVAMRGDGKYGAGMPLDCGPAGRAPVNIVPFTGRAAVAGALLNHRNR